jgi:hypothetical protein
LWRLSKVRSVKLVGLSSIATRTELRTDSQIRHVYDFTLAYRDRKGVLQAAPTLAAIHSAARLPGAFHVHVRRFSIDNLPHKDAELAAWVEQIWVDKDLLLEKMGKEWAIEENQ